MNTTKALKWAVFCVLTLPVLLFAQDETPLAELPKSTQEFWVLGIAVVSPLIVQGIKWAVPKIPKLLLPSVTPFIGMALGYGLNALGTADLGWVDAAQAGALAVFVREVVNQAVKSRQAADTPAQPPSG